MCRKPRRNRVTLVHAALMWVGCGVDVGWLLNEAVEHCFHGAERGLVIV
jgi:hypothetical protein